MLKDIFKQEYIFLNSEASSKEEALDNIATFAEEQEIVKSKKAYLKGLKKREEEITTGFKDGIAIPHCKHKTVYRPSLMLMKFSNPIEWESMDDLPVTFAFALAIPNEKNQDHLKILSTVSRALIDETFVQTVLHASSSDELYQAMMEKFNDVQHD